MGGKHRVAGGWRWFALGVIVVGVPVAACGGRTNIDDTQGSGANGLSRGQSAHEAGVGGSSGGPTASAFGPFPCTAYTAFYESCSPSDAGGGCTYYENAPNPSHATTQVPGESVTAGCKLEIVAPTSTGGTTCAHYGCQCAASGSWTPADGSTASPLCFP